MAVEPKVFEHVRAVLNGFDDKYLNNGKLKRNKIIEDLDAYDEQLMTALLSDPLIHQTYTKKLAGVEIFEVNQFIQMLEFKDYWEDSYTKYSNKIGLTAGGKFIDESEDVVLDFPFKDTVLKAGMSKEDLDKGETADEPFLNEVIAKPEIDELLEPKVFVNAKRYDVDGEHEADSFTDTDNLIIKSNNLIALYSLRERYAGKVQLVYLDPPYNTKGNRLPYNDNFNHSSWLTFMKNRLEILKDLLNDSGMIFINIDNEESHYLKILMDSVFGRENFQNDIIWHYSGWNKKLKSSFEQRHDDILVYTKDVNYTKFNSYFEPWKSPEEYVKKRKQKARYDETGRMYVLSDAGNGQRVRRYVDEAMASGVVVDYVWNLDKINNSSKEGHNFFGQKPESLLKRIIEAATDENDLVLDCFAGTGTTAAVALKLKRRFILTEQMNYVGNLTIPRLKDVLLGDQTGISKDVNWQGGGSFVYAELMEKNDGFIRDVEKAANTTELLAVFDRMKNTADFDFRVDLDKFETELNTFESLADQKRELLRILDKNQLYYNYANIDDANVRDLIADHDYKFNQNFYRKGGED